MRLWHQKLIPLLPRQQLLGQHRECCALRGKGWGRKHSVVNYVFTYPTDYLVAYHIFVMEEMKRRGYHPDEKWYVGDYRGTTLGVERAWCDVDWAETLYEDAKKGKIIYPEHNEEYLVECLENLKEKGIDLYEALDR